MATKKLYTGNWSVNNGSTYSTGNKDTDKRRLAQQMRAEADGNVFVGNTGVWEVYEIIDGEPTEEPVLRGRVKG